MHWRNPQIAILISVHTKFNYLGGFFFLILHEAKLVLSPCFNVLCFARLTTYWFQPQLPLHELSLQQLGSSRDALRILKDWYPYPLCKHGATLSILMNVIPTFTLLLALFLSPTLEEYKSTIAYNCVINIQKLYSHKALHFTEASCWAMLNLFLTWHHVKLP